MAIWDVATTALNPYLLYVKLALVVLVLASILGVAWYIKATFAEKDRLLGEKASLEMQLLTEKQRVLVAMEQLSIWQDTVKKMTAAVRDIKIQSNTYISEVDTSEKPTFSDGKSSIPFIMPSMSSVPTASGYANFSAGRVRPTIKAGRAIP